MKPWLMALVCALRYIAQAAPMPVRDVIILSLGTSKEGTR